MSVAYEAAKTAHFGGHPLGNSILGTVESITSHRSRARCETISRSDTVRRTSCWRSPATPTGARWSSWRRPTAAVGREASRPETPSRFAGRSHSVRSSAPTTSNKPSWPSAAGPRLRALDRYAAHLLATILGDHTGSRLYWTLIDPGLADGAELSYQDYNQAGSFFTFLSCEPEQTQANLGTDRRALPNGHSRRADRGRAESGQEQGARPVGASKRAADGTAGIAGFPLDVPPCTTSPSKKSSKPSIASP